MVHCRRISCYHKNQNFQETNTHFTNIDANLWMLKTGSQTTQTMLQKEGVIADRDFHSLTLSGKEWLKGDNGRLDDNSIINNRQS